ncbi:MAG TPA: hypothetical protein VN520_11910 [Streptomyces sp.]|uniref:hypothetical protein n=1 Tax=Streptomyces sp. TaxID=1931 RepID=UPI002BFAC4E5|nr:hypothetical protein [Streptomyces sp.]HWU07069.1 hypothetical protein [Streptomyces sp.]
MRVIRHLQAVRIILLAPVIAVAVFGLTVSAAGTTAPAASGAEAPVVIGTNDMSWQ